MSEKRARKSKQDKATAVPAPFAQGMTVREPSSVPPLPPEPNAKPAAPAKVVFSSYRYPDTTVLISRKTEKDQNGIDRVVSEKVAAFQFGTFETDDEETIAVLRTKQADGIYDNSRIDPETVPIEILNDEEHRVAVNARAALRLKPLTVPA